MKRIRIALTVLGAVMAAGAQAQSPDAFNGTWQLRATPTADPYCSQFVWRSIAIQQGALTGTLGHTRGGFGLTGQVASDGRATFYGDGPYGQLIRGNGQFTAQAGNGSIRLTGPDQFCDVSWTATRQH